MPSTLLPAIPDTRTGTYILVMSTDRRESVAVGRLGRLPLSPGHWLYVGSAFGPGGLRSRILHHGRVSGRPHWHIDYLRAAIPLREVWFSYDPDRREAQWVRVVSGMPEVAATMPGFGASDSSESTHLFRIAVPPSVHRFRRRLHRRHPGHAPVHRAVLMDYDLPADPAGAS